MRCHAIVHDLLYRFLTEGALPEGPAMMNHLLLRFLNLDTTRKALGRGWTGVDTCDIAFEFNDMYIEIGAVQKEKKERVTDESVKYLRIRPLPLRKLDRTARNRSTG